MLRSGARMFAAQTLATTLEGAPHLAQGLWLRLDGDGDGRVRRSDRPRSPIPGRRSAPWARAPADASRRTRTRRRAAPGRADGVLPLGLGPRVRRTDRPAGDPQHPAGRPPPRCRPARRRRCPRSGSRSRRSVHRNPVLEWADRTPGGSDMSMVDFGYFDCDNHYYEALDAFTRHIEPKIRKRGDAVGQVNGKQRLLVGGKINRFIPNPTFDPVSKPGALDEYFRGRNPAGPTRPSCSASSSRSTSRLPRTATPGSQLMDEQGIEARLPPDARRRHGAGADPRPAGAGRRVPGVQPLDGRRLGLRLPGAHLRRAVHHAGRPRQRRRRARVGARPRRPVRRMVPRTGA